MTIDVDIVVVLLNNPKQCNLNKNKLKKLFSYCRKNVLNGITFFPAEFLQKF